MNEHPTPELLHRFEQGDMGDHLAAHVALHVDDCAACQAQLCQLDPFAPLFAAQVEPDVPDDLMQALLADLPVLAPTPAAAPHAERLLGAALGTIGVLLATAELHPLDALLRATHTLEATATGFTAALYASSSLTLMGGAVLTLAVAGLLAEWALPRGGHTGGFRQSLSLRTAVK